MGALCKVPVLCVYNILYTLTYSSGFVRLPHLAVKPVLVPAHPQTLLTSVWPHGGDELVPAHPQTLLTSVWPHGGDELVPAHPQTLLTSEWLHGGDEWPQLGGLPSSPSLDTVRGHHPVVIPTQNHNVVRIKPSAVQVVFPEFACGNQKERENGEKKEAKEAIPGRPQCRDHGRLLQCHHLRRRSGPRGNNNDNHY